MKKSLLLILIALSFPVHAQNISIYYPTPLTLSSGLAAPFAGLAIEDNNPGASTDVVTISLQGTAAGTLSGPNLAGTGPYTLTATPATISSAMQALLYSPANLGGSSEVFNISVQSLSTLDVTAGLISVNNLQLTDEVPYPTPAGVFVPVNFKGVNIAGAENGYPSSSQFNYIYPKSFEIDYWASKGMGLIRMPLQLRRIQPVSYGPLDPAGRTDEPAVSSSAPGQTNLNEIKRVLDYALTKNMWVVIEPHNFGSVRDTTTNTDRAVGADPEATAQLVDWWIRVATKFKNYPNVIFNLMNEPAAQGAAAWKTGAVAAINGIAQVTTARWVFIPGSGFTGGHSWVGAGDSSSSAWAAYVPPAGMNIAFDMHEYLDSDFSGTHAACTQATAVMNAATSWAQANGFKIWIGEIGWSQDSSCPPLASALMSYFTANEPTYLGWAYWVGGSYAFYGSYFLGAVPTGYPTGPFTDAPQTSILTNNLN
jgi:endoglucanase